MSKLTILIVDDSLTFRGTLGDRLRREGHEVILAESGEQGVALLSHAPDAVIVDLVMPGMDGVETCRRMRRTAGGAEVPIMMLTARDDLPARIRGNEAGANEFLVKIHDAESLAASVLDFVRRTTSGPGSGGRSTDGCVFGRVVAASGLARIIAETAIQRACRRAGIDAERMSLGDLQRALPDIERSLSMFLPPEDRAARLGAIAQIAGRAPQRSGNGA